MRAPVATLVVLSLLTFVAGLGRQAITDGDEGYYAEAAREMVETGDWLTPHFNYQDRWQKPVLYYWVTATAFLITGPNEWSARAFSAFSGVLLVLVTYLVGRRMVADEQAAWLGAAIVATCAGYFAVARLALPDLPLALFITLTVFLWLEHRPMLAGAAAALGFLDKGPLAIALPAIILLPIAWREYRWPGDRTRVSLAPADLLKAAGVFALVGLPWYAAMVAAHGTAYLDSFFVGDNLERFATDRFNSPRALWFYLPIVIGGIFPWTAFLLVLPWRRTIAVVRRQATLTASEWRLLLWMVMPLIFFTISVGKQPRYILPVLPPLGLLLASSIVKRIRDSARSDLRGIRVATWLTALMYVGLAVLIFRAGPILINSYPWMTLLAVATLAAAGVLLMWTVLTSQWTALPWRTAISGVAALLALQFGALAGVRPEPVEVIADQIRAARSGNEQVGVYQVLTRNLIFYTGAPQVDLFDEEQVINFLNSNERVLLVARARDVSKIQAMTRLPLQAISAVDYIDPASIRLSTLLSPQPARDITDVMVVANK